MKTKLREVRIHRPQNTPMRIEGFASAAPTFPPLSFAAILRWVGEFAAYFLAASFFVVGIMVSTLLVLMLAREIFGWSGQFGPPGALWISMLAGVSMGLTYWSMRLMKAMTARSHSAIAGRPGIEMSPNSASSSGPSSPLYDLELDG